MLRLRLLSASWSPGASSLSASRTTCRTAQGHGTGQGWHGLPQGNTAPPDAQLLQRMHESRGDGSVLVGLVMVLAPTNTGGCASRSTKADITCCCYDAVLSPAYAHPSCSYAPPCALGVGLCSGTTGAALFISARPSSPTHLTVALCLLRRTTCCQIFLSSSMRTGLIRKSQAPCVTPRITVVCSSLADITAPTCKHTSTYNR